MRRGKGGSREEERENRTALAEHIRLWEEHPYNVSLYLVVFCNENTKKSFERFERQTPVITPT